MAGTLLVIDITGANIPLSLLGCSTKTVKSPYRKSNDSNASAPLLVPRHITIDLLYALLQALKLLRENQTVPPT